MKNAWTLYLHKGTSGISFGTIMLAMLLLLFTIGTLPFQTSSNSSGGEPGGFLSILAKGNANGIVRAATVTNGTFKIINRNSGLSVDVTHHGTTNGTPVEQWAYGSGNNQKWTLTDQGGGQYNIIGVESGRALQVVGAGTANGTLINIWDYRRATNQKWTFTATSSGYYRLTPQNATGSCLDVKGSSTANGAMLEIWNYNGGNSQQWSLVRVNK